jgi:hypothetical protein
MAKSFRERVESIVFAGLKPGAPPSQAKKVPWIDRLRQPMERYLNAGASSDPLCLSNRARWRRAGFWVLLIAPCVLVAALAGVALLGVVRKRDAVSKELTPAQIAAKALPADLDQSIQLHIERDLDAAEVRVDHTGVSTRLVGTMRNRTDKTIAHAEVVFDLADQRGSGLGAVSAEFDRIPPLGSAAFQLPIEQTAAAIAIVRDVRTR